MSTHPARDPPTHAISDGVQRGAEPALELVLEVPSNGDGSFRMASFDLSPYSEWNGSFWIVRHASTWRTDVGVVNLE